MATIVTRSGKGSPLTNAEMDSNLTNLNTDKLEYVIVASEANLPGTGSSNIVYVTTDTNSTYRWNGASYDQIGGGGGGGGISYTTKTTTYTAVANEGIIANTNGGAFTVTLPATPAAGTIVAFADGADWSVNNLTVARNSSTIEGVAEDLVLDVGGVHVTLIYDGTTWQVFTETGAVSSNVLTSADLGVTVQSYSASTPTTQISAQEIIDGNGVAVRSMTPADVVALIQNFQIGDVWALTASDITYTYDGTGKLTQVDEVVNSLPRVTTVTYNQYDDVATTVTTYNGVQRTETYVYDGTQTLTDINVSEVNI